MCKLDSKHAPTIGLEAHQFKELADVFEQFSGITSVIVYGSRAKGNYHNRSDLDLAITLMTDDRHRIAEIKLALDESNLVPSVDLQNRAEITNPSLKDHIQRRGIELKMQNGETEVCDG